MKTKLFLTVLCLGISTAMLAQTEKGSYLIGGSFDYSYSKSEQEDNFNKDEGFRIAPNYAHFVGKNFAVGLLVSFNRYKASNVYRQLNAINGTVYYNDITSAATGNTFTGGPVLRYYIDLGEKFKFYGQFNASIGVNKSKNTTSYGYIAEIIKSETLYYNAAIQPGFALFPTKHWAIELGFDLISFDKERPKSGATGFRDHEAFSFGLSSFSPSIGMNYYF